jgi:hypothetical protein
VDAEATGRIAAIAVRAGSSALHQHKQKDKQMTLKNLTENKYLKGADIVVDEVVTILECRDEIVGKDKEVVTVLYLEEYPNKGIILNKTNAMALAKAYGIVEANLPGKKLVLFTERVRSPSSGEMVDAIRMEAPKPKKEAAKKTASEISDPIPF